MEKAETKKTVDSDAAEMELLEFKLGEDSYGIEIEKVRELLQYLPVQKMPSTQDHMEGVICPRGEIFPVVNLAAYLQLPSSSTPDRDIFIITDFNQTRIAFHVHRVVGIHHLSWDMIQKPETIYGCDEGVIIGIAKAEKRMIAVINFEKIIAKVAPEACLAAQVQTA
jgi:two-component system chemotaxis response regulator CheV